jgi:hypothetical protein
MEPVHCNLWRTYEDKTAHHVHTGADAGVESDLVGGNHPLAAGLCERTVSILIIQFLNPLAPVRMRSSL